MMANYRVFILDTIYFAIPLGPRLVGQMTAIFWNIRHTYIGTTTTTVIVVISTTSPSVE